MPLTNSQVENLSILLLRLGEKKHPMLAYRVAMTNQAIRPVLEALKAARAPAPDFLEFATKHGELCEQCAEKDAVGHPLKKRVPVPAQNGWVDDYVIADAKAYQKGTKDLEGEYAEAIATETKRQQQVAVLLQETVELEFSHGIKYSWCKELLSGNDMMLMLDCELLQLDEELDDTSDTPEGDTSDTPEE